MFLFLLFLLLPFEEVVSLANSTDIPTMKFPALSSTTVASNNHHRKRRSLQSGILNLLQYRLDQPRRIHNQNSQPPASISSSLDLNYIDDARMSPTNLDLAPSTVKLQKTSLQRKRQHKMLSPMSEEYSGMQIWNSLNLSGRRERPLYVEELPYILVRREMNYPEMINADGKTDLFIPPRGRKNNNHNLFSDYSDFFMPQRGKKEMPSFEVPSAASKTPFKRNDILMPNEYFFPNRGKKSPRLLDDEDDLFFPNRGKKGDSLFNNEDLFYPNRGKKEHSEGEGKNVADKSKKGGLNDLINEDLFFPNRGKRAVDKFKILNNRPKRELDDILADKDTFYSARGRKSSGGAILEQHFKPTESNHQQYSLKTKKLVDSGTGSINNKNNKNIPKYGSDVNDGNINRSGGSDKTFDPVMLPTLLELQAFYDSLAAANDHQDYQLLTDY